MQTDCDVSRSRIPGFRYAGRWEIVAMWLCVRRLNSCRNQMHDLTNVLCRWRPFSRRISILWALVEEPPRLEGIKASGREALRLAHFEWRRFVTFISA
jgi:hypothetical protein